MRSDRAVKPNPTRHGLAEAKPGINRHAPGYYVCACGMVFTGLNKYEQHRADARKAEDNGDE